MVMVGDDWWLMTSDGWWGLIRSTYGERFGEIAESNTNSTGDRLAR